jgi:hypothetical protein
MCNEKSLTKHHGIVVEIKSRAHFKKVTSDQGRGAIVRPRKARMRKYVRVFAITLLFAFLFSDLAHAQGYQFDEVCRTDGASCDRTRKNSLNQNEQAYTAPFATTLESAKRYQLTGPVTELKYPSPSEPPSKGARVGYEILAAIGGYILSPVLGLPIGMAIAKSFAGDQNIITGIFALVGGVEIASLLIVPLGVYSTTRPWLTEKDSDLTAAYSAHSRSRPSRDGPGSRR